MPCYRDPSLFFYSIYSHIVGLDLVVEFNLCRKKRSKAVSLVLSSCCRRQDKITWDILYDMREGERERGREGEG